MNQIPILLGGFALFIYGMHQMGKGLELAAGDKLQSILRKITSNKFIGVLIGALVTSISQSSSATTVMAVGFVNSKLLTLSQAVSIIMGANIGTTVTGLLLSLKINIVASIAAFVGITLILFVNKRKYNYIGTILFGFGMIFIGMNIMSNAVKPLSNNLYFTNLLASATNPIFGILIGAIFTAIIQSSSATTGVLITLANSKLLTFSSAFYIVLGANIGTCVTSLLSSIGTSKNAKRVAISHIIFNVIGTLVFTIVSLGLPIIPWISSWSAKIGEQIAYMHVFFNVTTTILLLPFSSILVKISKKIIKGEDKEFNGKKLLYLNKSSYHDTILTIEGIKQETLRMYKYSEKNLELAIENIINYDEKKSEEIKYNEEVIDYLNKEITNTAIKTLGNELNKTQYNQLSYYIKITSNIERLGDYAYNINSLSSDMNFSKIKFTEIANKETIKLAEDVKKLFIEVTNMIKEKDFNIIKIKTISNTIKENIEINRELSLIRLKNGIAEPEAGLVYDKLYSYLLRTRDHLMNITNYHIDICE